VLDMVETGAAVTVVFTDGKVSAMWMTADEPGALSAVDAVAIRAAETGAWAGLGRGISRWWPEVE
jgi:hypothetical protein